MNILIVGNELNLAECRQKFGEGHSYELVNSAREAENHFKNVPLILDFILNQNPQDIKVYSSRSSLTVFVESSKISLIELGSNAGQTIQCSLFGFCGVPTFLNRDLLEVALYKKTDEEKLKKICTELNTKYAIVDDRVGLVTPRVVCMIINEAYYTVQEGTATREDIDQAMKLGTNYPFGPFEWAQRIGIKNVYELLEAVYNDTKDERYKICPLLKREYLQSK